ncbi:MAG: sensor histidine kinase [Flavobacteriaceae bacterium]|nr:sensor histidine kinase [Flavobacteriaceae bacterium]MBT4613826.1 sensor histidine kinase [Flavobacteriaceae bacterium]MBT6636272.1 sensor histidine kinase [Flavobacteriaceae bacterium]MBT7881434.1 sensor histidine kinase [Flavobacteriaceae bacterium]
MPIKNTQKNPYQFALISASLIAIGNYFILLLFYGYTSKSLIISILIFIISFIIIQYRIQGFLFKRFKELYQDLDMLDSTQINKSSISTDMDSLMKNIEEFAKNKKIEIEALKLKEQYRKEFIGNVAHELKTPIFTIQGYISNLLDGAMDDKELLNKYLKRTDNSVERLSYIIKDLDLITQLESSTMNLNISSFNMIDLIFNIFDHLEIKSSKRNIKLVFDKKYNNEILVSADKERIGQVLTNLLVNSINYGRDKGTTEVSINDLTKEKLIVRVTDNGEGISKKHFPRLFERFYRVDISRSRKHGGSGLGLAIVKHIIDAHNENIYINSKPGVGSEFSFTLQKSL